jgi:hypothetical protein
MVNAEVNFPSWAQAIDLIYQKAYKMSYKTRYHPIALPLISILLCVSTRENFQQKWMPMVEQCLPKLKDKSSRQYSIGCISRIIWVYLNRCPDPNNQLIEKKLDAIFKIIFPSLKKSTSLVEFGLDHYALIIYFVTSWSFEYSYNEWYSSLLHIDLNSNTLDPLLLERLIIVMKATVFLMLDTFKKEKTPMFPYLSDFGLPNPLVQSPKNYPESLDELVNFSDTKLIGIINTLSNVLSHILPNLELLTSNYLINDEKYCNQKNSGALVSHTQTTTSISESFSFAQNTRDILPDSSIRTYSHLSTLFITYSPEKQIQFDFLKQWLNSLPHLIPPPYTVSKSVDLCVKYLVHIDPQVSIASAHALKRLAKTCNLHILILKQMIKLIKSVDPKFSEVLANLNNKKSSCGGLEVLGLFLEILESWLSELNRDDVNVDGIDTSNAWTLIEELEAIGLLLLCSTLHPIREHSLKILNTSFLIEKKLEDLIYRNTITKSEPKSPTISLPGRVHLSEVLKLEETTQLVRKFTQKDLTSSSLERLTDLSYITLEECAISSNPNLISIWFRAFPSIVNYIHEKCPIATVLCRHYIYTKLVVYHNQIKIYCDEPLIGEALGISIPNTQLDTNNNLSSKDIFIDQWGQYLCFATVSTNTVNDQLPSPSYSKRKASISEGDPINSAKDLFRMVFILLSCENSKIRNLAVNALSNINIKVYGAYLENLLPFIRLVQTDTQNFSKTKRQNKQNRFRAGIAKCLMSTSHLLKNDILPNNGQLEILFLFLGDLVKFLNLEETQEDWMYQSLRIDFFKFSKTVYEALNSTKLGEIYFSFDLRMKLFQMAEQWCGHGQFASITRDRELRMMGEVLSQYTNIIESGQKTSEMENERKRVELEALNLMATLCNGPIIGRVATGSHGNINSPHSFDISSIFRWIEAVFMSPDKRLHFIPKKALDSLLLSNTDHPLLFESILHNCYAGDLHQKATQEYFLSLSDLLTTNKYSYTLGKQLFLLVFKAGDPSLKIRKAACKALEAYWSTTQSQNKELTLDRNYLLSLINNPLTSVYEQAQFDLSLELSSANPQLSQEVLSEVIMRFTYLGDESKRRVINCLSAWTKEIKFELDGTKLSQKSIGILKNLLYMVIKYADLYPLEVENLFKSILNNPANQGYINYMIDFLLDLSIRIKTQSLIINCKKVLVYSLGTNCQIGVVNYLLQLLSPVNMIVKKFNSSGGRNTGDELLKDVYSNQFGGNLYVVDLDELLIASNKSPPISIGQLALVFLSDLILENMETLLPQISLIIHLSLTIIWTPAKTSEIIQEQSFQTLKNILLAVNLKLEHDLQINIQPILDKLDALIKQEDLDESELDSKRYEVVNLIVQTLNPLFPELIYHWIQISTYWSTNCPVRTISTISLKILKFLGLPINLPILKIMLLRLSNSLMDTNFGIQVFCKELLITLKNCLQYSNESLKQLTPPLFWFTSTCLQTSNESEFLVLLEIIEFLIFNADPIKLIEFNALKFKDNVKFPLPNLELVLIRGLSSKLTSSITLRILDLLFQDGLHKLFGNLVLPVRLILVYHLNYILGVAFNEGSDEVKGDEEEEDNLLQWLIHLTEITDQQALTQFLQNLSKKKLRGEHFFIRELVQLIKGDSNDPKFEEEGFHLLLGLLTSDDPNSTQIYLKVLKLFITMVNPELFKFIQSDSPLLKPLLGLLDGEFKEEALEVIEDIISFCSSNEQVSNTGLIEYFDGDSNNTGSNRFDSDTIHQTQQANLLSTSQAQTKTSKLTGWIISFNFETQQTMRDCLSTMVQDFLNPEDFPPQLEPSNSEILFSPLGEFNFSQSDLNMDHFTLQTPEFIDDRASAHYNPSLVDNPATANEVSEQCNWQSTLNLDNLTDKLNTLEDFFNVGLSLAS